MRLPPPVFRSLLVRHVNLLIEEFTVLVVFLVPVLLAGGPFTLFELVKLDLLVRAHLSFSFKIFLFLELLFNFQLFLYNLSLDLVSFFLALFQVFQLLLQL